MLNLDPAKLLVISTLVLIVMGPERLPGYARQLGNAWRTLSSYREHAEAEIRKVVPTLDIPNVVRNPSMAASGFLRDLIDPTSASSPAGTASARTTEFPSGPIPAPGPPTMEPAERAQGRGESASSSSPEALADRDRAAAPSLLDDPTMN